MNEYRREYLRRKASDDEKKAIVAEAEQKSRIRKHSKLIAAGVAAVGIAMLAILPMRFRAVADSTDDPAQKYLAANVNPKIVTATSTVDAQSATFDKNEVTQFAETLMTGESANLTKAFWLKADFITVDSTVADSLGVKMLSDVDAHAEDAGLVISESRKSVQLFSPSEESLYYVGLLDYTKVEGNGRLADIEFSYCGQPMSESDGLIYDSATGIVYVPKSARTGKVSNSGTSFDEETPAASSGTTTEIESPSSGTTTDIENPSSGTTTEIENPSSGTTTEIENPSSGTTTEIENPSSGTTTEIGGTQWQLSDAHWASSTSSVLESTSVPVNAENAPDVSNDDLPPLPEAQFMYVISGFTARGMISATPAEIEDAKAAEPVYTDFSDIVGDDGEQAKDDTPMVMVSNARSDAIEMSDADAQALANVTVTIAGQPVEQFDIQNRTAGMDVSDMPEVIESLSRDVQMTSHSEYLPVFNGLPDGWTVTHEPELQTAKSCLSAAMPGNPYCSSATVTVPMRLKGPNPLSDYVYYFDYGYTQWYLDGERIAKPSTGEPAETLPVATEGTSVPLGVTVVSSDPDLTAQYPETYAQNGEGAVYGLFKTEQDAAAGTTPVKTFTITSAGSSNIESVDAGTYYVKQLTAPKGYEVDAEVHAIEAISTGGVTCALTIVPEEPAPIQTAPKQVTIQGARNVTLQPDPLRMVSGQWYAVDPDTGQDIPNMKYECTSDNPDVVSVKSIGSGATCILRLTSTQAGTAHITIHMVPTEQYVAEDIVIDVTSEAPHMQQVLEIADAKKPVQFTYDSRTQILAILPMDCGSVSLSTPNAADIANLQPKIYPVYAKSIPVVRDALIAPRPLTSDTSSELPFKASSADKQSTDQVRVLTCTMNKPVTGKITLDVASNEKYMAYRQTWSLASKKTPMHIICQHDDTIPAGAMTDAQKTWACLAETPKDYAENQRITVTSSNSTVASIQPLDVYNVVGSPVKTIDDLKGSGFTLSTTSDSNTSIVQSNINSDFAKHFRIRGEKAGKATIKLNYKPSSGWFSEASSSFEITVTAAPKSQILHSYVDNIKQVTLSGLKERKDLFILQKNHGKVSIKSSNPHIHVIGNTSTTPTYSVTADRGGVQGDITFTVAGTSQYAKFTRTIHVVVNRTPFIVSETSTKNVTMEPNALKLLNVRHAYEENGSKILTKSDLKDVKITYTSSDSSIVRMEVPDSKGPAFTSSVTVAYGKKVTIQGLRPGTTTIKVKTSQTSSYASATAVIKVTVSKATPFIDLRGTTQTATTSLLGHYAGNVRTQSGKVTVTSSNPSVATATVSSYIWSVPNPAGHIIYVTPRQPGTAKMTVKVAGNNEFKAATKTFTIKVTQCSMDSISRELQNCGTLKGAVQKDVISNPAVLAKARVGNGYEFQAPGTFKTYPYVGTVGKGLRMDTIDMVLVNGKTATSGEYAMLDFSVHCQGTGWKNNDSYSGAPICSKGRRLEAIKINLTGGMRDKYDIYYRVHSQTYGWLAWAKNGAPAGSEGHSKRMEAIQIVVMKKGAAAPSKNYAGIKQANAKAFVK